MVQERPLVKEQRPHRTGLVDTERALTLTLHEETKNKQIELLGSDWIVDFATNDVEARAETSDRVDAPRGERGGELATREFAKSFGVELPGEREHDNVVGLDAEIGTETRQTIVANHSSVKNSRILVTVSTMRWFFTVGFEQERQFGRIKRRRSVIRCSKIVVVGRIGKKVIYSSVNSPIDNAKILLCN